jgi:hypothetical protein
VEHEPAFQYAVIRAAPDLPAGFLPAWWEGRWYDLSSLVFAESSASLTYQTWTAVRTDRFERRDDGTTARVYEVRP